MYVSKSVRDKTYPFYLGQRYALLLISDFVKHIISALQSALSHLETTMSVTIFMFSETEYRSRYIETGMFDF